MTDSSRKIIEEFLASAGKKFRYQLAKLAVSEVFLAAYEESFRRDIQFDADVFHAKACNEGWEDHVRCCDTERKITVMQSGLGALQKEFLDYVDRLHKNSALRARYRKYGIGEPGPISNEIRGELDVIVTKAYDRGRVDEAEARAKLCNDKEPNDTSKTREELVARLAHECASTALLLPRDENSFNTMMSLFKNTVDDIIGHFLRKAQNEGYSKGWEAHIRCSEKFPLFKPDGTYIREYVDHSVDAASCAIKDEKKDWKNWPFLSIRDQRIRCKLRGDEKVVEYLESGAVECEINPYLLDYTWNPIVKMVFDHDAQNYACSDSVKDLSFNGVWRFLHRDGKHSYELKDVPGFGTFIVEENGVVLGRLWKNGATIVVTHSAHALITVPDWTDLERRILAFAKYADKSASGKFPEFARHSVDIESRVQKYRIGTSLAREFYLLRNGVEIGHINAMWLSVPNCVDIEDVKTVRDAIRQHFFGNIA